MTERTSKRVIMYPVDKRNEETLMPIIERHVAVGSKIFTDGWAAYKSLNERGYEHFTVLHKYQFKKEYK